MRSVKLLYMLEIKGAPMDGARQKENTNGQYLTWKAIEASLSSRLLDVDERPHMSSGTPMLPLLSISHV